MAGATKTNLGQRADEAAIRQLEADLAAERALSDRLAAELSRLRVR